MIFISFGRTCILHVSLVLVSDSLRPDLSEIEHENGRLPSAANLSNQRDPLETLIGKHSYTHVAMVSAPVSTACSWWFSRGDEEMHNKYGHLCGIIGEGTKAIHTHFQRLWALILEAHRALESVETPNTLRVFLAPEWTFRRYPQRNQSYVAPLSAEELRHIFNVLEIHLKGAIEDFDDWLILPGSVFWGLPLPEGVQSEFKGVAVEPKFAIFNTLPVFYNRQRVHTHNKMFEADNLNHKMEIWGYKLTKAFTRGSQALEECSKVGGASDRICGADRFEKWIKKKKGDAAAQNLRTWGLQQPSSGILINGLVIGIDICLDHRARGKHSRASERLDRHGKFAKFDLQFLVSSGMTFLIPEADQAVSLLLREGGIALSSDGVGGPFETSRVFVKKKHYINTGWRKGQPATLLGFGRTLRLSKDFTEQTPEMLNSWKQVGCAKMEDDSACKVCNNTGYYEFLQQEGRSDLCDTEVGNWRLLKVWGKDEPLQLEALQNEAVEFIKERVGDHSYNGPL